MSREVRPQQLSAPRAGTLRGVVRAAEAYTPQAAENKAGQRRRRPKHRKLERDPGLCDHVLAELRRRWSPEQIARRLPRVFPDQPERRLCHETIYQALYVQPRGELRREHRRRRCAHGRARRAPA